MGKAKVVAARCIVILSHEVSLRVITAHAHIACKSIQGRVYRYMILRTVGFLLKLINLVVQLARFYILTKECLIASEVIPGPERSRIPFAPFGHVAAYRIRVKRICGTEVACSSDIGTMAIRY